MIWWFYTFAAICFTIFQVYYSLSLIALIVLIVLLILNALLDLNALLGPITGLFWSGTDTVLAPKEQK